MPRKKDDHEGTEEKKTKKPAEKVMCDDLEGKVVPASISLKDSEDKEHALKVSGKETHLVLAFQPVDHLKWEIDFLKTFDAKKEEFEKAGAKLFMVCTDSAEAHKKFKEKQGFSLTLLSDSDKKLIDELGTKNDKGRYLRHVMVLDAKNKCVKHWKDLSVKDNTAEPVLEFIKAQKKK